MVFRHHLKSAGEVSIILGWRPDSSNNLLETQWRYRCRIVGIKPPHYIPHLFLALPKTSKIWLFIKSNNASKKIHRIKSTKKSLLNQKVRKQIVPKNKILFYK
jgi:hypothetical protein